MKVMARDLAEKFPNPPVKEVAYEIRFPPDLRILAELYRYQQTIKDKLPKVGKVHGFEISLPGGIPSYLEGPWLFEDSEDNLQAKITMNSFAVTSRKHKTFDRFYPQLKDLTERFIKTYSIPSITRVGLRYINDITLGSDSIGELSRFFVSPFDHARIRYEDLVSASAEIRRKKGDSFLTLRVSFHQDQEGKTHYVIDTDSYFERNLPVGDLFRIVETLHDNAIREFHDNITDAYVERLRKG